MLEPQLRPSIGFPRWSPGGSHCFFSGHAVGVVIGKASEQERLGRIDLVFLEFERINSSKQLKHEDQSLQVKSEALGVF